MIEFLEWLIWPLLGGLLASSFVMSYRIFHTMGKLQKELKEINLELQKLHQDYEP